MHKGDTQPDDPEMTGIRLRGKTYVYRKRIPADLCDHPNYAHLKTKVINRTLKTSDLTKAKRNAANLLAELENEFAACRKAKEMELSKAVVSEASSSPVIPYLRTSKLTREQIDAIWVTEFERLERESVADRNEYSDYTQDEKDVVLADLYTEFSLTNPLGKDIPEKVDWGAHAEYHLEVNSAGKNELTDADFAYLKARLKAVSIEVIRRNIDVLHGKAPQVHDALLQKEIENHKTKAALVDLAASSIPLQASQKVTNTTTIKDVIECYIKLKKQTHPQGFADGNYTTSMHILADFFGEHNLAADVSVEQGLELVEFLKVIPFKAKTKYTGKTLMEASKLELTKPEEEQRFLAVGSYRTYFTHVNGAFQTAVDLGKLANNVLDNKLIRDLLPAKSKHKREQISEEELTLVLSSPDFQNHKYQLSDSGMYHSGIYWSILLCMHHGMRLNEACQMHIADVKYYRDVAYMNLIEFDDDGNKLKNIKREVSRRNVPIHQRVIDLGFLDFVEHQSSKASLPFLFPELAPNEEAANERFSVKVTRAYSQIINKYLFSEGGAGHGDKKAHTLRHKVTMKLRIGGVAPETRYHLLGWTGSDDSSEAIKPNAGWGYGISPEEVPSHKELLDTHVTFPDFDYSVLTKWEAQ